MMHISEEVGGQRSQAHLQRQVGGNGDAGAQVDVAVFIAHKERGVPLGLGSHPDPTAVLRPRLQPPCNKRKVK